MAVKIAEREIASTAKPGRKKKRWRWRLRGAGKTGMDFIRAKINAIGEGARDLLAEYSAAEFRAYRVAYTVIVLGGSASLIIAVLVGLALTRSITNPVTRMTSTMGAADGDTSIAVPEVGRADELGTMAKAVRTFRDSVVERQRAQELSSGSTAS